MRQGTISRATGETSITVELHLDGSGNSQITTGIGFFDHMLTALVKHAGFNATIHAKGDLVVDCHHTVEDTGIVLGQALALALGERGGICRYGSAIIPMDEALSECVLDISGRPYTVFSCPFVGERIGDFDTQLVEEFFRAFSVHAGITLHLNVRYGKNDHHMAEAAFKSAAHALRMAVAPADGGILSTKGVL